VLFRSQQKSDSRSNLAAFLGCLVSSFTHKCTSLP
jgi:hypothetical protein